MPIPILIWFEREGNIKQAAEFYSQFLTLSPGTNEELKKKIQTKIESLEKK